MAGVKKKWHIQIRISVMEDYITLARGWESICIEFNDSD